METRGVHKCPLVSENAPQSQARGHSHRLGGGIRDTLKISLQLSTCLKVSERSQAYKEKEKIMILELVYQYWWIFAYFP